MTERTAMTVHPAKLMQLKHEARHAREAFDSYKEEIRSSASSSPRRLRDLKQAAEYADARFERARRS